MDVSLMEVNQPSVASSNLKRETPPILEMHDITVAYHRRPVLWNVDLSFSVPKLVGIIGANGAGKSTLIKAALGLIPIASGDILVHGKPFQSQRRLVGYVPQRESVDWEFPVTVMDVVLMGTYGELGWFRRPGAAQRNRAMDALRRVHMESLARRQIGQLSGGQQQRVFLARALAQNASIYFLDEPMAGVDAATEQAIFAVLQELVAAGKLVLVVHHDLRTAARYFDEVILLNMRVVANGPTSSVLTAENLQRTYGGRLALLDVAGDAIQRESPSE